MKQISVLKFKQRGQGMTEFAVAASFFLVPLFMGIAWLARVESSQQHMHQAARYAAWERTVWYQSSNTYITKSDTDVAREVTKRVFAPANNVIDTNRDRQAINANSDKLAPFLYTPDYSTGNSLPMFKSTGGQNARDHVAYAKGSENNLIAGVLNSLTSFTLGLQSEGIATSTVSTQLEVIPSLANTGGMPNTFTSSAHNALLGGAWNTSGPSGEKQTVQKTVITDYFNKIPMLDTLLSVVGLVFKEFSSFDLGHVDTEKMACQRVNGITKNC